jgi:hypothetical protein
MLPKAQEQSKNVALWEYVFEIIESGTEPGSYGEVCAVVLAKAL